MAKNIGSRLYDMLNEEIMTDVTFIVEGTEIKGHRNVVSSYRGPLRQLLEAKEDRVKISDEVSLCTFKTVLQYLYTDECTIGKGNVFELLYAAKTFQLEDLVGRCVGMLTSSLTIENFPAHFTRALHFEVKEYLRICMEYFRMNTSEVLTSKEILEVSNEVLLEFIGISDIGYSDLELFTLCTEWAKNGCKQKKLEPTKTNIRALLQDVLGQIKFYKIPRDDFLNVVAPMQILTDEEVGRIINSWQKVVKVTIAFAYWIYHSNCFVQCTAQKSLPMSTTISQVKEMEIFSGVRKQYPTDKFTLEHKGKELADDMTLASIYSPGEDLILKLHSLTFTIKERNGIWQFPLMLTLEEYERGCKEFIKEQVAVSKGIQPARVIIMKSPITYPGDTVYVEIPKIPSFNFNTSNPGFNFNPPGFGSKR